VSPTKKTLRLSTGATHRIEFEGEDVILKCDKCSYAANTEKARHRNSETTGLYSEVNKLQFGSLRELLQTWREAAILRTSMKLPEDKHFPLSLYVLFTDKTEEPPTLLVMDRTRRPHELFLKSHLKTKKITITPLTPENSEAIDKLSSPDVRVCFDDNIPGMT